MPEACRITDPSHCPADAHGCPKCPHDVTGPATSGSVNVLINGQPAPPSTYMYDAASNSIKFNPNATPQPGQTLTIDYATTCF